MSFALINDIKNIVLEIFINPNRMKNTYQPAKIALIALIIFLVHFTKIWAETFSEQFGISLANVDISSAVWGDYDCDGDLDILLTGYTGSTRVSKIYRNNGNNDFAEQTGISLTGVQNSSVAWGDYDNDGDLDILLTGYTGSARVSKIYRNNGNNSFSEQTGISLTGVQNGSVAWGDYDNDGDLDILLTGNTGSTRVSKIYRNNSNNSFTVQSNISLIGVDNSSVAWGDYNNDGYIDILLTGKSNSNGISKIYQNNGKGNFIEQTNILLSGITYSSVAWGDYDSDGYLDILMNGNTGSTEISKIYHNNGNNSFTEQTDFLLPGVQFNSAVWGDYDNDGDLDILLTEYSTTKTYASKIYQNNSNQSFTELADTWIFGVYNGSAAWGDYDNDGDLDILITGSRGITRVTRIYRNDIDNANKSPEAPKALSNELIGNNLVLY